MREKEKLYEILGELLYVISMADGQIQQEEKEAIISMLAHHPWATETIWSFEYEIRKKSDVENIYKKVINYCHKHGPSPEYAEFIEAMNQVANAINGIEDSEAQVISSFSKDLIERFIKDTEKLRK